MFLNGASTSIPKALGCQKKSPMSVSNLLDLIHAAALAARQHSGGSSSTNPTSGMEDLMQLLESTASSKPTSHSKSSRLQEQDSDTTGSLVSLRLKHSVERFPFKNQVKKAIYMLHELIAIAVCHSLDDNSSRKLAA